MAGTLIHDNDGRWYSSVTAMYTILIYRAMLRNKMKADDVQVIDVIPFIKGTAWFRAKKNIHGTFGRVKQHCKHWSHEQFESFARQEESLMAGKEKKEVAQLHETKTTPKEVCKLYFVFEDTHDSGEPSILKQAMKDGKVHLPDAAIVFAENDHEAVIKSGLEIDGETRLVAVEIKSPAAYFVIAGVPPIEVEGEDDHYS